MSSLHDRMAALAAGDVVEIPGTRNTENQTSTRADARRSPTPNDQADRRVSLG